MELSTFISPLAVASGELGLKTSAAEPSKCDSPPNRSATQGSPCCIIAFLGEDMTPGCATIFARLPSAFKMVTLLAPDGFRWQSKIWFSEMLAFTIFHPSPYIKLQLFPFCKYNVS